MIGGERKINAGRRHEREVFEETAKGVKDSLDRISDPEYFSECGLGDEEKTWAVEILYLVLEFAQENNIIDGYDDAKMRKVCGEGVE